MSSLSDSPVRLDKWLWAARFFKTRSLAQDAIEQGRVRVNDERVKTARLLRVGERVSLRADAIERVVIVQALSETRGPAPVAQTLYQETPESMVQREAAREKRRLFAEPAQEIVGRPTKRDRRHLDKTREGRRA
ncbi:MAG: RNA-binding S4 domain-containing protein [Burkholderiaceae bacterium]